MLGMLIRLSALYQSIDKGGSRILCSRISRETPQTRTLHRFARKRNIWLKLRGLTSVSSFRGEINAMPRSRDFLEFIANRTNQVVHKSQPHFAKWNKRDAKEEEKEIKILKKKHNIPQNGGVTLRCGDAGWFNVTLRVIRDINSAM